MIRVGSRAGALAAALRQAATVHDQNAPLLMSLVGKISYLVLLPILGCPLLIFLISWVVPKFVIIFQDFHMKLPPITVCFIRASDAVISCSYLLVPLMLLLLLSLGYTLLRYFGVVQWDVPPMNRLTRRLDSGGFSTVWR